MTAEIDVKQGQTLRLGLAFQTDAGVPMDISTGVLSAQVRDAMGRLVADLDVQAGGTVGLAAISAMTGGWPIGRLVADVRLSLQGEVDFSTTFVVSVARSVTV